MCSLEKETEIKKALRSLCSSYGWTYGFFWRFHYRNSMLLTLEDAYSKEYARSLTDDMLLQVHMLGDGVIGQAALDGKHRWVFSNSLTRKCGLTGHARIQEDNSNFSCEFSSGIKTMAVIPVESCGVLQFGSVNEMLETPGFVDHARQIFREVGVIDGLVPSGDATSSLITDSLHQSGHFAHLISSCHPLPSSCTDPISTTNNSMPISACFDNQGEFLGYNPLSFLGGFVDNQCLGSLFHEPINLHGFDELNSTESLTTLHQDRHVDDSIGRWLYSVQDPTLNDDLLQTLLAELPASSLQAHLSGGKETPAALPSSNADTFSRGFETHFGYVKREETLEDILFATGALDHPSEIITGSAMMPQKGLFSELGLDQLLSNRADSGSFAKSSIEDLICSPKKRRVEGFTTKSQTSLWSDKCFTADAKSSITDQTKRPHETSKVTKKRARPGESPRSRPKDRQMIQDRIKELREIIPNSSKCSIDSLLDRTIKHMLFMQSVAKYIDKLKRVVEAKAQRDGSSGSTAWAIEFGGHNPIVVEDLGHSGEMLIEMICEEQGFFLEIADVIRGFGLAILKGVMEARDGKIRAHFIVEANRHVTRMEVLMSLVQLLKDSSTAGSKAFGNTTSSLLNNDHHQPMVSLPIGLR